jgi:peptide/nickel transport system permease protein
MGFGETRLEESLRPPSGRHPLGTDRLGRDVLVRLLWGGRASLAAAVASAALLLSVGVAVGALAGFHGGRVDLVLSRVIEVFQCFPTFLLIVTAVALIPEQSLPPLLALVLVIALVNWTGVARLVRAEFLRARELDYVAAARALGFSTPRIVFGHVLPNVLGPVQVAAAFALGSGVLIESGVSFLGFGVRHPVPSWGSLLSESRTLEHWWLVCFPGLAIFAAVLGTHVLGETLREALEPRPLTEPGAEPAGEPAR